MNASLVRVTGAEDGQTQGVVVALAGLPALRLVLRPAFPIFPAVTRDAT